MFIFSVLSSIALAADYAVPGDYPTVQGAVIAAASANDTQAVVLVDPSYTGANSEGTVFMFDFEGTIRSSVNGQRAEVPALHMITNNVELIDLDVRLDYFDGGDGGPNLWWAAIGIFAVDGTLTATNVQIDGTDQGFEAYTIGILAQGQTFLEQSEETDGVYLTDVVVTGMTAGAMILFTDEVEITGGLVNDNGSEIDELGNGSGISIYNAQSASISALTCDGNTSPLGDFQGNASCLYVRQVGETAIDGLTATGNTGGPIHALIGGTLSLTNSSFSNTTEAFAGAGIIEDIQEVTVSDLTVENSEGSYTAGIGFAAGFNGEGFSEVTASNITGTNLLGDIGGLVIGVGFVFIDASNLKADNVEAENGSAGLTLFDARGTVDGIEVIGGYSEYGGAAAHLREFPFLEGPGPEPSRRALEEVDCTENITLDVTNASVTNSLVYEGGVLYSEDACLVGDTLSVTDTVVGAGGAAIGYNSGMRLSDLTVTDVDVDFAGGVLLADSSFISLNGGEINNVVVGLDNSEGPSGGGVVFAYDSFVTVQNVQGSSVQVDDGGFALAIYSQVEAQCVHFCDIRTEYGGVLYIEDDGSALIEESSFSGVTSDGEGGSAFYQNLGEESGPELRILSSNFIAIDGERVMDWGFGEGEVANSVFKPVGGSGLGDWSGLDTHHNAFLDVVNWDDNGALPGDPSTTFNLDLPLDAGFLVYSPDECLAAGYKLADDSPLVDAGVQDEGGNATDIGLFGSDNACPIPLDYDGDTFFDDTDCDDFDADVNPNATEIPYDGIDNDCADGDECDVDGDTFLQDGEVCGGNDCDDTSADFNPDATDTPYDGIDHNCDGLDPCDVDGDGYDYAGGECGGDDCNDDDNTIHPGAVEVPYDGIDNDCANGDECDVDGDGYLEDGEVCGGDDCNDIAEAGTNIHPGADEIPDDGIDQDCDGEDLLCDADEDGFKAEGGVCGGDDCDDTDAAFNPDATDTPYDGIDNNCDGLDPCDVDGDGFDHNNEECAGSDCNDNDAAINPDATDVPDDGIDQDCSGADTVCDSDGDGYSIEQCGGDDCDDTDANVNPGVIEVPYNGVDEDCDGTDLCDVDGDGYDAEACPVAGDDCNDDDLTIYTGAVDVPNDGIDQNCNSEDATAWLQGGCSSTGGAGGPVWFLALLLPLMRRREVV